MAVPQTPNTVSPGPTGSLSWKGLNWNKRSGAAGGPGVSAWIQNNIVLNSDGTLTFRMTSSGGCELDSTRKGFGYGDYWIVIETPLNTMGHGVVWGSLFPYDGSEPTGSHNEIDIQETSSWGGSNAPTTTPHHWGAGTSQILYSPTSTFNAPTTAMCSHMRWEPGQLTYWTYAGLDDTATLIKTNVTTDRVPVPRLENLIINLWQFSGALQPIDIIVHDFAFVPASSYVPPVTGKTVFDSLGGASGQTAFDSLGINTTPPTVPSAPVSVAALAGDTTAAVLWTIPVDNGNAAILSYTVTTSPADVGPVIVSGALTTTITGLFDGVSYTFTVNATNIAGDGPGTTSTPVIPLVANAPGGNPGGITPPDPTPDPGGVTPSAITTTGITGGPQGNIALMYLKDDLTNDTLVLSPLGSSGLGVVDFDPGYPTIRESIFNLPSRDGTYDVTAYVGNSAVSLSLLAFDGIDYNGVYRPAGYWVDVITSWLHPARRPTLVWQLKGQVIKQAVLRASQFSAPVTSSGAGRSSIAVQVGWKNPSGVVYTRNQNPNLSVTPNDGRNMVSFNPASSGLGEVFPIVFPVMFGVSGDGTASVPYLGQVPAYAEIDMFGGATDPEFILEQSVDGTTWNLLPSQTLNFTGLTVQNGDILRIITGPSPSAFIYTAAGAANNVRRFISQPPQWWTITPATFNRVRFNAGSENSGTVGYVFYYDTFLR